MEFHPRYEEGISRFNRFVTQRQHSDHEAVSGDSSIAPLDSMASSMAATSASDNSQRIDNLEREMGVVRGKVDNMDSKLDILIAAATPAIPASTPRPRQSADTSFREDSLPAPQRLRRDLNRTGYVDRILQEEKFRVPHVEGKVHLASDVFIDSLLPKPYMYVTRENVHTLKQKLDVRSTLAPMEYVHAALALVNDRKAYNPGDREGILKHIQDVAHDAMERPWEDVRKWSQCVWDMVEKGSITWSEDQLIYNQRVNIAMTGGGGLKAGNHNSDTRASKSEVVCRQFNVRTGCRHKSHHEENGVRHLHICAFCDSLSRHCPGHNVIGCNSSFSSPEPHAPLTCHTTSTHSLKHHNAHRTHSSGARCKIPRCTRNNISRVQNTDSRRPGSPPAGRAACRRPATCGC